MSGTCRHSVLRRMSHARSETTNPLEEAPSRHRAVGCRTLDQRTVAREGSHVDLLLPCPAPAVGHQRAGRPSATGGVDRKARSRSTPCKRLRRQVCDAMNQRFTGSLEPAPIGSNREVTFYSQSRLIVASGENHHHDEEINGRPAMGTWDAWVVAKGNRLSELPKPAAGHGRSPSGYKKGPRIAASRMCEGGQRC